MPTALARKSFPVRMARLGWDLGLYPLPGAPPRRLRQRSHPLATQASRPAPCRRRGHDLPEPQQDLPAWRRPPALRLPRPDQGECAAPLHVPAPPPLAPDGVRCGASPTVHAEAADPLHIRPTGAGFDASSPAWRRVASKGHARARRRQHQRAGHDRRDSRRWRCRGDTPADFCARDSPRAQERWPLGPRFPFCSLCRGVL